MVWTLFAIASVSYLIFTYRLSSEAPYLDDYEALLNFLISLKTETNWWNKIGIFFQSHNEHRIVVPRFIVWIQYMITGELNLRLTLIIANLMLVGIVFLLLRYFLDKTYLGIQVAAIVLLFNYAHFENYQWALSGLQNYGVVLLALSSLVGLIKGKPILMVLFALLAVVCSSSGLVLLAVFSLYHLFKKEHTYAVIYAILLMGLAIAFFGIGFPSVHSNEGPQAAVLWPRRAIKYYLTLFASYTGPFFRNQPLWAMITGCITIMLNTIFFIRLFLHNRFHVFIYLNLFITGTLVLIAIYRFNFGVDQAFASRYMIFSTLYLIITVSMLFYKKMMRTFWIGMLVGILLMIFSAAHYQRSQRLYTPYTISVRNHLNNTLCAYKKGEHPVMPYIGKNDPLEILKKAEESRIIQFSDACK